MYLHFVGKEVLTLSEKNGLGVRLSKCTAGCYTLCANTSFNTLYYIISLIVRIDYITTTKAYSQLARNWNINACI